MLRVEGRGLGGRPACRREVGDEARQVMGQVTKREEWKVSLDLVSHCNAQRFPP